MKTTRFFSIVLLFSLFINSISAQMSAEQLKKIAKESFESIINHDLDKFGTYMADNAIDYAQGPEPVKGRMAIVEGLKGFFSAFPDYKVTLDDIAVSGNRVYLKNEFKATHTMPLMGMIPATGKKVDWSDTDIVEFDNMGKIVAHWANNPYGPMYQIGYGSLTNPNVGIVMAAYGEFGKGNVEGVLANIAENATWDATESPLMRFCKGKAEVRQFITDIPKYVSFQKFEPARFIADGDDVIVLLNVDLTKASDKKAYSVHPIHHFIMKNGKIMSFKETIDTYQPINTVVSKK